MDGSEKHNGNEGKRLLPTRNQHREFHVSGRMVTMSQQQGHASGETSAPQRDGKLLGFPVTKNGRTPEKPHGLLKAPEILSLEELARRSIDGLDYHTLMDQLTDRGPDARLLLAYRDGKLVRQEIFEDPRICKDIHRGAVIHNLEQKPADVSGWRVHDFYIDSKGCLGEICSRCIRVCPENAIHLRGDGAGSFAEIDPKACKGCFICWVECTRKSADCILIDGKVFHSELRAQHFGE